MFNSMEGMCIACVFTVQLIMFSCSYCLAHSLFYLVLQATAVLILLNFVGCKISVEQALMGA